jgi:dUTP pyrophosphatase
MKVRIKRIDNSLPLPIYETPGSVGFDILCRKEVTVLPSSLGFLPSNVIVQTPPGYMLLIALRSSSPKKHGFLMPHGIGIIDNDYCGEKDEIKVQVYNFTPEPVTIKRGEKVAQGVFVRIEKAEWDEVEVMSLNSRGGFGSTDK